MWMVVYYPDSNRYCVLERTQIAENEIVVGSCVTVVNSAQVLFINSSKTVCDKECDNIRKKSAPSEKTGCDSTPDIPSSSNDSKIDAILSYMSRIDSNLREVSTRQKEMQQNVEFIKTKIEHLEQSEKSLKVVVQELLLHVLAPSEVSTALTYPYNLTKEKVDDIYQAKRSATAFARAVERELFIHDDDKDTNLDKRNAQEKVRWLRELIRCRYPSSTPTAEASLWSACQIAINDYHRKKRKRDGPCADSARETRSRNGFCPDECRPSAKRAHIFEISSDEEV